MNKNSKKSKQDQYKANRKKLIELSKFIRPMVAEGMYDTVNDRLREIYEEENPDIVEFNTFNQWKKQGYTILKGSKAYLFWGQPRKVEQAPEGEEEPQEFKFYPLAYLFSNLQVIKPTPENKQTAIAPQTEPELEDLPF